MDAMPVLEQDPGQLTPCWACGEPAARDPAWREEGLRRCGRCGLLFSDERDSAELKELYDQSYFEQLAGARYEADGAQRSHEATRRLSFLRAHAHGPRLLEVGAAAGHFLAAAREAGFAPTGIEPAAPLAARAGARAGVPVAAGFVEDMSYAPGSFDAVCAWHVLEHLREPLGALVHLRDWLAPDGALLVEVPNLASVQARRAGKAWPNLDLAHHVAHYTPAALRALLERAGFGAIAVSTFPMRAYLRPGLALRPRELAGAARDLAVVRASLWRSHPERHEMLRAVARVPA